MTDVYQWLFISSLGIAPTMRAPAKEEFTMRKSFTVPAVLLIAGIITTILIRRNHNHEKFN